MDLDRIREYYRHAAAAEQVRLSRSTSGRIEFAVNLHYIRRHIRPRSRVLDVGGATGQYTLALAEEGHQVTLVDLSPDLLVLASENISRSGHRQNVEAVLEGDARDLASFPSASFDVVLSLGPFYHLIRQEDREQAAAEMARVLRPGGHAFVAFMPRTTLLRYTVLMAVDRGWKPGELRRTLEEGVYFSAQEGRFTEAYYPVPGEMESLIAAAGVHPLHTVASEGISAALSEGELDLWSERDAFQELLEVCLRTAEDALAQGASVHLMMIGQKPGQAAGL